MRLNSIFPLINLARKITIQRNLGLISKGVPRTNRQVRAPDLKTEIPHKGNKRNTMMKMIMVPMTTRMNQALHAAIRMMPDILSTKSEQTLEIIE